MAKKKDDQYFDALVEMGNYACDAAVFLRKILGDYNPDELDDPRKQMHNIEHNGDTARHNMIKRLSKEFITPIEREDIMAISESVDTVTDKIEDVLLRLYMFNIREIRPEALEIGDVIVKCTSAMKKALEETQLPEIQDPAQSSGGSQRLGGRGRQALQRGGAQCVYRWESVASDRHVLESGLSLHGRRV